MSTAGRTDLDLRFPFPAIVGQERMKRALLLNAVNPGIGGVLVRGSKGTAKSTAVRSLAALLPAIEVVAGCPFSCAAEERPACPHCSSAAGQAEVVRRPVRIVDLPVGASEDRLVGSLDIERAIQSAEQAFEPGLLAAAHRGVLYIDEVNLLSDHLVDLLLDAAAMGRNYVERDGLSVVHPSRFILVGTMNPEEGELRPQLLDRFGLMVEAENRFTTQERMDVVRRRVAFEGDPETFAAEWQGEQDALRARLRAAQDSLAGVRMPDEMLEAIAHVCEVHEVDGLRADIVIHRAATTIAAWEGRAEVTLEDVREASSLALVHRQRRQPFEQPHLDPQRLDDTLDEFESRGRPREQRPSGTREGSSPESDSEGPHPGT